MTIEEPQRVVKRRRPANRLKKYGVTDEQFFAERAKGNRWCSRGKHFVPATEATKAGSMCKPCSQAASRKWYAENHDRAVVVQLAYRARNREREIRRTREWYDALPPERRRQMVRHNALARKFGITQEWYDTQLAKQGGVCAICGEHVPIGKNKLYMSIDHDHTTGALRGILCHSCNVGVSWLEKPGWHEKAFAYLAQHKSS